MSIGPEKATKGEIDPWCADPSAGRHTVHPVLLAARMHDQKIAIGKGERLSLLWVDPMFQAEIPRRSQRQRSDRFGLIDLSFIVRMPAHAVVSIAVKVQKAAVEAGPAGFTDLLQQWFEPFRPAFAAMECAAVAILNPLVSEKNGEPGNGVPFAVHLNQRLLPVESCSELRAQPICPLRWHPSDVQGPRQVLEIVRLHRVPAVAA